MITVKLYGLLRIESGIKEKQLEAATVKEVLDALADCGISKRDLNSCVILVNGTGANKRSKLENACTYRYLYFTLHSYGCIYANSCKLN